MGRDLQRRWNFEIDVLELLRPLLDITFSSDPRDVTLCVNNTRGSSPAWLNVVLQVRISFFSLLGRAESSRVGFRVLSRPLGGGHVGPNFEPNWTKIRFFFDFFFVIASLSLFYIVFSSLFCDFGSIFGGFGRNSEGFSLIFDDFFNKLWNCF